MAILDIHFWPIAVRLAAPYIFYLSCNLGISSTRLQGRVL